MEGFDPTQIVACALRPQASWSHGLALLGFVLAAWSIAPRTDATREPLDSER